MIEKFKKEPVVIRMTKNASFWDVFKFIITFGKKGRLWKTVTVGAMKWKTVNDPRVNCRCVVVPTIKDKVEKK